MSPREWLALLANLFRKSRMETQLADELAAHIEEAEKDYIESGMVPEQARLAARRDFGGVEQVKERYRDQLGFPLLEELWRDCRHGLRSLRKSPGFTAVSICSLALGIGANTAIFTLFQRVMVSTLPVEAPESLVYLYSGEGPWQGNMSEDEDGGPSFSYPLFRELQAQQTPFTGLAGARSETATLTYDGRAAYGEVRLVSGNYFALLGVRPALGRLLDEGDDKTPGAHPLAVLDYRYWESRLGADPGILNRTILINHSPMTIVGVIQKDFFGERIPGAPQAYIPISMREILEVPRDGLLARNDAWVTMFGRLKPGVGIEQAEAEINGPYRAQVEQDISLLKRPTDELVEGYRARSITLVPGQYGRGGKREESRNRLALMLAMSLLVLLLACANVANLQLARGSARLREAVVRRAIGASRSRLVRLFLIEAWMLAVAGALLGLLLAQTLARTLAASVPAWRSVDEKTAAGLDPVVLLFCLALSTAAALAFGLYPALKVSNISLSASLKDQASQASLPGSASAFRKTLVGLQVAITTLLLITSGLLTITLVNLHRADLGVKPDHLLTFGLSPKMNRYTDQQVADLHQRLTERLRSIPGVAVVSSAQQRAIAGSTSGINVGIEGYLTEEGEPSVNVNWVSEDYFTALGIPVMRGRQFTSQDDLDAPKTAIVNEAFVRKYIPDRDALGAILKRDGDRPVVGVVKDAVYAKMREEPPPTFYLPLRQKSDWSNLNFYLRTTVEPEALFDAVRREAAEAAPSIPISGLKTMEMQLAENTAAERTYSLLTSSFAALAMLLATVGLYGVLAFNVARRRREFGIRIALGAEPGQIRKLVASDVLAVVLIGTVAGVVSAAGFGQLIESALFGLEPWNGPIYFGAIALVWIAAIAVTLIPAQRAARLNPLAALRHE